MHTVRYSHIRNKILSVLNGLFFFWETNGLSEYQVKWRESYFVEKILVHASIISLIRVWRFDNGFAWTWADAWGLSNNWRKNMPFSKGSLKLTFRCMLFSFTYFPKSIYLTFVKGCIYMRNLMASLH